MSEVDRRRLVRAGLRGILPAAAPAVVSAFLLSAHAGTGPLYLPRTLLLLVGGALGLLLLWLRDAGSHPFARLGPANQVTILRGGLVLLLPALLAEPASPQLALAATVLTAVAATLDSLDGALARRTGMSSRFGSRLDMETDALLILLLCLLAWHFQRAGAWILVAGLLRYAFVAASLALPWLQRPLYESRRRKSVAAVQMALLIAVLFPPLPALAALLFAVVPVVALLVSFGIDVWWLWQRRAEPLAADTGDGRAALALLVALVMLNGALTFHNVWPTPYVHWPGELSVEIAALLLILALWSMRRGQLPAKLPAVLAVLVLLGMLGRYGEVTAPALYGREVNLYWDLRNVGSVVMMLGKVAAPWQLAAGGIALLVAFTAAFAALRWSWRQVSRSLQAGGAQRAAIAVAAATLLVCFAVQRSVGQPPWPQFSIPVSSTYAAQLHHLSDALGTSTAARQLPPSPLQAEGLAGLHGADVIVLFLESYGRITYDRPELATAVAGARQRFADAARETQRGILSAYVSSPTFGGSSWLAHLSLLSGIETRGPQDYDLLMSAQRASLPALFSQAGYRAIAWMPGLKSNWPEGAFYHFDQIYGTDALNYQGPPFGWWKIPDQFSLSQLDALELERRDRKPAFVFFPTINTHMPFRPTPPYQPDWSRMTGPAPYDPAPLQAALRETPEWLRLTPAYGDAVSYTLDVLAGYLRKNPARDFVLIVLGDHQPPAAVSGAGTSWDVPVHIVARDAAILDAMRARGFVDGIAPPPHAVGRMQELSPWLLRSFAGRPAL
ncbi:MAG: CDP-alcohol phosphatidyltransferase family protein [Steroidobacteraceae bacterium]